VKKSVQVFKIENVNLGQWREFLEE
jgi:hypothetical protein